MTIFQGGTPAAAKEAAIAEVVDMLRRLTPVQTDVVRAIISRFAEEQVNELMAGSFLSPEAFEYFSMRLAAHHAYSSSVLKKENFEHILEQAFLRTGIPAQRADSMTQRGADLAVGNVMLSLKTEAARDLKPGYITISKLMEAAWIKQITSTEDIPRYIQLMVMPHFANYDRIFILRCYPDPQRFQYIRYDLREIPKHLLEAIGLLRPEHFSPLTKTRTTSASVYVDGVQALKFRLDGSDDKLTITSLDVNLCPLQAWWSLSAPV